MTGDYAFSYTGGSTEPTLSGTLDTTAPSLGDDWYDVGTVTVTSSTTKLTITNTAGLPSQICLLQQTSATDYNDDGTVASTTDALGNTTAFSYDDLGQQVSVTQPEVGSVNPVTQTVFDDDGDVTATIDPLGRVTATTYDEYANLATTSQGQIIVTSTGATTEDDGAETVWTFGSLSPNSQLTYEIYIHSDSGAPDLTTTDYTLGYIGGSTEPVLNAAAEPNDTPLGDGWYDLGTIGVSSSVTALTVTCATDSAPDQVALLQQTASMAYDSDGDASATFDALGRVSASYFDTLDRDTADYQGQVDASATIGDGASSWSFANLSPNSLSTFDVYVYSATPLTGDWQSGYSASMTTGPDGATATLDTSTLDTTAPDLGDGWYDLGTITVSSAGVTGLSVSLDTTAGGTVALLQRTTATTYDLDGNTTSEIDGDGNTTYYAYNDLNRVVSQSQSISLYLSGETAHTVTATTGYLYDADGDMIEENQADGLATAYGFDHLNRESTETWYPSAADAAAMTDSTNTIAYAYDLDGEMTSAQDDFSDYTFAYDTFGRQASVDNNGGGAGGSTGTPYVPDVKLTSTYDADGDRLSLSALIDGTTSDFVNNYQYDTLQRETQVAQSGDGVDDKLATFGYDLDGETTSIDRYNDLTGSSADEVAKSTYSYDSYGDVTGLTQANTLHSTTYAGYGSTYDADREELSFTNSAYSDEGIGEFTYTSDGELIGATQATGTANAANSLADVYDANGNATSIDNTGAETGTSQTVDAGNTVLFDGAYYDTYNCNGDLIQQENAASTSLISYGYDNRDRLTSVTYASYVGEAWQTTREIVYTYDMFNNLLSRTDTTYSGGDVTATATQRNVIDLILQR